MRAKFYKLISEDLSCFGDCYLLNVRKIYRSTRKFKIPSGRPLCARDAGIVEKVLRVEGPIFGHLLNMTNFNTSAIRPNLYEVKSNPKEWEKR